MKNYFTQIISLMLIGLWSCTDIGAPCSESMDCAGECGGNAIEDCAGTCGGNAVLDGLTCTNISYATTIQSIFTNNCGGCHIGSSSGGLNLSNYNANFNYNVVSERISLTNDYVMPPPSSESLTQNQIDLITQWVSEGALDN